LTSLLLDLAVIVLCFWLLIRAVQHVLGADKVQPENKLEQLGTVSLDHANRSACLDHDTADRGRNPHRFGTPVVPYPYGYNPGYTRGCIDWESLPRSITASGSAGGVGPARWTASASSPNEGFLFVRMSGELHGVDARLTDAIDRDLWKATWAPPTESTYP
jgi:hypothetical protein